MSSNNDANNRGVVDASVTSNGSINRCSSNSDSGGGKRIPKPAAVSKHTRERTLLSDALEGLQAAAAAAGRSTTIGAVSSGSNNINLNQPHPLTASPSTLLPPAKLTRETSAAAFRAANNNNTRHKPQLSSANVPSQLTHPLASSPPTTGMNDFAAPNSNNTAPIHPGEEEMKKWLERQHIEQKKEAATQPSGVVLEGFRSSTGSDEWTNAGLNNVAEADPATSGPNTNAGDEDDDINKSNNKNGNLGAPVSAPSLRPPLPHPLLARRNVTVVSSSPSQPSAPRPETPVMSITETPRATGNGSGTTTAVPAGSDDGNNEGIGLAASKSSDSYDISPETGSRWASGGPALSPMSDGGQDGTSTDEERGQQPQEEPQHQQQQQQGGFGGGGGGGGFLRRQQSKASVGSGYVHSPPPTGHNRKVSWGGTQLPNLRSASTAGSGGGSGGGGHHTRYQSGISLRDVMSHNPYETEAEAHVLSALEEMDPTHPGLSDAQQTLLGDVPEDVPPEAFEYSDDEENSGNVDDQNRNSAPATTLPIFRPTHTRNKTRAQELWELTKDLKKLQRSDSRSSMNSSEDSKLLGEATTDAETLVQNAANLIKRHGGSLTANSTSDDSSLEGSSQTPSNYGDSNLDPKKNDDGPSKSGDDKHHRAEFSLKTRMKRGAKAKARFRDLEDWLSMKKFNAFVYVKVLVCFVMIPATGLAAMLYYLFGNPPCSNGICTPKLQTNSTVIQTVVSASASWWLLFIFVRQAVTFTLARATMSFLVDYLCLRTKIMLKTLGPLITLFVVQSKGWPITLFFWGVYDFAMLYGRNPFAKHWLYWQNTVDLMNDTNPAGTVTHSPYYTSVLIISVVVSFVVSVKRFLIGLHVGRRTYTRYGADLAKVIKKALLIGQVASLARDLEISNVNLADFGFKLNSGYEDNDSSCAGTGAEAAGEESAKAGILDGIDISSRRVRINELLGEWEEPEDKRKTKEKASIGAIIQFRQSLSCLGSSVPFSAAFGLTTTRQECVACSEALYNRLLHGTPGATVLSFDVLALLAIRRNGELDEEKIRALIKIFRPDREGNLTLLDFAKSIDAVYKELRLLRASVDNSSKLDRNFESVFNVFFYFLIFFVVVAALGMNPLVLFASVSGFILGFAFMIGSACSKYVEGLLLIFVRRPYDVGDRIHVSDSNSERPLTGSAGWIVKDIDLYTTTVVFGATNEVATHSNGSLAASRIINAARSPLANMMFTMKFPIDTPYEKLKIFKSALEKFIKARPREWAAFLAFRSSRVEADFGFVEYTIIAQHRESWQTPGALLDSKSDLASFALELSKKMNMRYVSPPMPIDLTVKEALPPSIFSNSANKVNLQKPDLARGISAMSVGTERERGFSIDYAAVAGLFD